MRIGVISDTHLRTPDTNLEYILQELLADTEIILHAGDIVSSKVLERLQENGVLAVCGNMDDYDVAGAIPQIRIIPAAGKRIGLIHGWGSKEGLAERVISRFKPDLPDIIVFGHSHVPFEAIMDGTFMFNPGSAKHNRYRGTGTVGIIEIVEGKIYGSFLPVKSED